MLWTAVIVCMVIAGLGAWLIEVLETKISDLLATPVVCQEGENFVLLGTDWSLINRYDRISDVVIVLSYMFLLMALASCAGIIAQGVAA